MNLYCLLLYLPILPIIRLKQILFRVIHLILNFLVSNLTFSSAYDFL